VSAAYIIRRTTNNQYYFNLTADNNETILTSEQYQTEASALKGIESVRANAAIDARYARRVSTNEQHYFVLLAANGEPIGTSELYASQAGMESGIASVKHHAPNAPVRNLT
jgi:uncharacterized protein YegP (UPF0339 family)